MRRTRQLVALAAMLVVCGAGVALGAPSESDGRSESRTDPAKAPSPPPGGELEALRTPNSQTYLLADGARQTRIFQKPVNYRDANGKLEAIDVELSQGADGKVRNGDNRFDAVLPERLDVDPVRFGVGEHWVSMRLRGADSSAVEVAGAEASYEADSGVEFVFTSLPEGLKEEIELSDPSQPSSYEFELRTSSDLRPRLTNQGAIEFLDAESDPVVVVPAPMMHDSAKGLPRISKDVRYRLRQEGSGVWQLTVEADREWLQAKNRAWPVTIDPSLKLPGPTLDCSIIQHTYYGPEHDGWPDCDYFIMVAHDAAQDDVRFRGLLRFDLSAMPPEAEITSATLGLLTPWEAFNTSGIEVKRLTKSWTSNVNWGKYDGTNSWNNFGGDFTAEGSTILTSEHGNQSQWWNFSEGLAPIVQDWVDTPSSNHGFLIKLRDDPRECADGPEGVVECVGRAIWFHSSEAQSVEERPYLDVEYYQPPPETTISSGPTGVITPEATFTFDSSQEGSSFECSLDAAGYSPCTSPVVLQGLSEGPHTFRVRAEGASETPDPTPAERSFQVMEVAKALPKVSLLDSLERQEVPLANGKWSKSSWAGEIGGAWMGSYRGYGSSGSQLAGAYWNPSSFNETTGAVLTAAIVGTGAALSGQRLTLWLNMPNPGSSQSGYEARFEGVNGSQTNYKVELSKWAAGSRTVLAATSGFSLPVNTTMVLTDSGDRLTLWTGTSTFTPVLAANDAAYSSGYAGLEVNGGSGTEYGFRAGNIDIQPPETAILSGPSGKITLPEAVFTFNASEGGASFECSMDDQPYTTCASPKAYVDLAKGSHVFRVRARDSADNLDPTPAERGFEVVEPPETTITSAQPSYTSGDKPPIEFASSKPGSTFKCSLDGPEIPTTPCTSPYALPESLGSGWHTFRVIAVDEDGHADSTPAAYTFNPAIYPPAPTTSKLSTPQEGYTTSSHYTLKAKWGTSKPAVRSTE